MQEVSRSRRQPVTTPRARRLRNGGNHAEGCLWLELKDRRLGGYKFVRQFPVGPYFADFICRVEKLVVEVDGSQHDGSSYDQKRNEFMNANGYSVIRFWSADVLQETESVCYTILAALEGRFDGHVKSFDLQYFPSSLGARP